MHVHFSLISSSSYNNNKNPNDVLFYSPLLAAGTIYSAPGQWVLCKSLSFFRVHLMNCLGSAGCRWAGTLCGFQELCFALIKKMKVMPDRGWTLAVASSHHRDYLAI